MATTPEAGSSHGPAGRGRLDAIDLVRGVVMILMLLDHTRDFTHEGGLLSDPLDPATTTPWLYLTRWITHLCAPTFVFLAGLSVGLRRFRGAETADLRHILWTRGLWLVFLEFTLFRLIIWFNLDFSFLVHLQVINAIGVSMIVLSALIGLPTRALAAIGAVIVLGHNALDTVRVPVWTGPGSPVPTVGAKLWMLAHQGGFFPVAGFPSPIVWAHYPVLPWIGIMLLGCAMADLYAWPPERRRRVLLGLGSVMVLAFVVLRAINVYGDPRPWSSRGSALKTAMSFMDVTKYPPSLLYALVTLAPCLLALALFDGRRFQGGALGAAVTFGRVPFLFYLLQWPFAHLAGLCIAAIRGQDPAPIFMNVLQLIQLTRAPVLGGPLWATYLCWMTGVVLLYWPCQWFAGVKARRRDRWLSYL